MPGRGPSKTDNRFEDVEYQRLLDEMTQKCISLGISWKQVMKTVMGEWLNEEGTFRV